MVNSHIARADLDTEMTVVRNEMESGENNPGRILMQRTLAAMYDWHPYGRSVIGARSDVENVDIPRLQAFYKLYYQPDNATLIVSGKFDTAQVLRWAGDLAGHSDHRVSRAIAQGLAAAQGAAPGAAPGGSLESFTALPGRGVQARVAGQRLVLGNHRLMEELGLCNPGIEARLAAGQGAPAGLSSRQSAARAAS